MRSTLSVCLAELWAIIFFLPGHLQTTQLSLCPEWSLWSTTRVWTWADSAPNNLDTPCRFKRPCNVCDAFLQQTLVCSTDWFWCLTSLFSKRSDSDLDLQFHSFALLLDRIYATLVPALLLSTLFLFTYQTKGSLFTSFCSTRTFAQPS